MPKYVVLGAGVAGLAAAVTLVRKGETDVLVLEREDRPGGLCRSFNWQGCTLDLGPHRLLITVPRVEHFIRDLLGNDLLTIQRKSQMVLYGHRLEYPVRVKEVLTALGIGRSLHVLGSYFVKPFLVRKRGFPESSYAGYISRRFGTGLYDLLFRDYAFKVWQEDPDALDAAVARTRLSSKGLVDSVKELLRRDSTHAASEFLYPKAGIGQLPDRMAAEVVRGGGKIEYGVTVSSVGHASGGNRAIEYGSGERMKTAGYQYLISSIPLPSLVSRLRPLPPDAVRSAANTMRFSSLRIVSLLVARPRVSENCWMYFPDRDLMISRLYEVANFSKDLVPRGKTCLVVEIPCRTGDPPWRVPEKHLSRKVIASLDQIGLVKKDEVKGSGVMNVTEAYPVYRRGYRSAVDLCCEYLASIPGVITTGRQGLFCYNNADHSIDMGIRAGEAAAGTPEDLAPFYAARGEFERYRIVD
jgi:protoporphyrinogen oxidase